MPLKNILQQEKITGQIRPDPNVAEIVCQSPSNGRKQTVEDAVFF